MQEQADSPTTSSAVSSWVPPRAAWCPWTLASVLVAPLLLLQLAREPDRAEVRALGTAPEIVGVVAPAMAVAASPPTADRIVDVGLAIQPIPPRVLHQPPVAVHDCPPLQAPLDLRREPPAKAASGSALLEQTSLERPAPIKDTPRRRAPTAAGARRKAALPAWQFKR